MTAHTYIFACALVTLGTHVQATQYRLPDSQPGRPATQFVRGSLDGQRGVNLNGRRLAVAAARDLHLQSVSGELAGEASEEGASAPAPEQEPGAQPDGQSDTPRGPPTQASPSAAAHVRALRAARKLLVHKVSAGRCSADGCTWPGRWSPAARFLVEADPFHFAEDPGEILRSMSTSLLPADNASFYLGQEICAGMRLPEGCQCDFEAYVQFWNADQCTVYFVSSGDLQSGSGVYWPERYSRDAGIRFAWLYKLYQSRVLRLDPVGNVSITKEGAELLAANGYPDALHGSLAPGQGISAASLLAALSSKPGEYSEQLVDCPWAALVGTTQNVPDETRDKLQMYNREVLPQDFFQLQPPCPYA